MGESKRMKASQDALLIDVLNRETVRWMFPRSTEEDALVAELNGRPLVMVPRVDRRQLFSIGMKPKECHANTGFYADNDPSGQAKQVYGWWKQEEAYILHSVIRQHGVLMCITPQHDEDETPFSFIEDSSITWKDEGQYRIAYRNGWELSVGVRIDPDAVIAKNKAMKELLSRGIHPREAMRLIELGMPILG